MTWLAGQFELLGDHDFDETPIFTELVADYLLTEVTKEAGDGA